MVPSGPIAGEENVLIDCASYFHINPPRLNVGEYVGVGVKVTVGVNVDVGFGVYVSVGVNVSVGV